MSNTALFIRAGVRHARARLGRWQHVLVLALMLLAAAAFASPLIGAARSALARLAADGTGAAGAAAALFVIAGLLAIVQRLPALIARLASDPVRDPWLVLGGPAHALAAIDVAWFAARLAVLLGLLIALVWPVVPASRLTGVLAMGFLVLAATTAAWAACGAAATGLAHARPGRLATALLIAAFAGVTLADVAVSAGLPAAAEVGALVSSAGRLQWATLAGGSLLCAVLLWPSYLRSFEPVTRDRLRARVSRLAGHAGFVPRPATAPVEGPSIFGVGLALMRRTMLGRLAGLIAMSCFVGVISIHYRRTEGPLSAALFAVTLFALMLAETCRRTRVRVGGQHEFLMLHRRNVPSRVWRHLVAGQASALAVTALTAYTGIAAFHITRGTVPTFLVLALPAIELAFWLGLLAHLLGTGESTSTWLHEVIFVLSAVVLAAIVAAKTLVLLAEFPLLLGAQSLALVAVAILLAGRPPLDLRQILAEGRS